MWSWGRHVSSEPVSTFVKRRYRAGPGPACGTNVTLFLPTTHCWAGPCCCWPGWLGQPMADVRSAQIWLFWLADVCWPKGGGGWGTGPGSTSTLVRRSPRWQKELGLRSHQACVRISARYVAAVRAWASHLRPYEVSVSSIKWRGPPRVLRGWNRRAVGNVHPAQALRTG